MKLTVRVVQYLADKTGKKWIADQEQRRALNLADWNHTDSRYRIFEPHEYDSSNENGVVFRPNLVFKRAHGHISRE
jgi:hypothetical protein